MKITNLYVILSSFIIVLGMTSCCKRDTFDTSQITQRDDMGNLIGASDPDDWRLFTNAPSNVKSLVFNSYIPSDNACWYDTSLYHWNCPLDPNIEISCFPNPIPHNGNFNIVIKHSNFTKFIYMQSFPSFTAGYTICMSHFYDSSQDSLVIPMSMRNFNNQDSRIYYGLITADSCVYYGYGDVQAER